MRARLVGREIVTRELNGEKYSLDLETLVWKKLLGDVELELMAEDTEDQFVKEAQSARRIWRRDICKQLGYW